MDTITIYICTPYEEWLEPNYGILNIKVLEIP